MRSAADSLWAETERPLCGNHIRPQVDRADAAAKPKEMLAYMCATLDGQWNIAREEAYSLKIRSGWGTVYDFEQLFEHAIVHVLRHRRQIERFLGR